MTFTTAFARFSDPATSHEAAASVKVRESQQKVMGLLKLGPATDEALANRAMQHGIRISPSGLRTRRSELVALSLVVDSGVRVTTANGRKAIVWAVANGK
jgi:hypothetical protein